MVWECDEKRGTLRRKEGDGNERTREKKRRWLDRVWDETEDKGLSEEEVYDRATYVSVRQPHIKMGIK